MNIISCKEAKKKGLKRYYTGKPCKHGHIAERQVTGGCVVCSNLDQQRYYRQNPEKHKASTVAYREKEENREIVNAIQRKYYKNNSHKIKAEAKTYRGLRALRVPSWSETSKISSFYKNCPDGYEVDHILPLQGKTVSGLHVFNNLQYLPMSVNRSKYNKVL